MAGCSITAPLGKIHKIRMSSYNERIAIKQKESNMKEKWYGSQRGGVGGGSLVNGKNTQHAGKPAGIILLRRI